MLALYHLLGINLLALSKEFGSRGDKVQLLYTSGISGDLNIDFTYDFYSVLGCEVMIDQ